MLAGAISILAEHINLRGYQKHMVQLRHRHESTAWQVWRSEVLWQIVIELHSCYIRGCPKVNVHMLVPLLLSSLFLEYLMNTWYWSWLALVWCHFCWMCYSLAAWQARTASIWRGMCWLDMADWHLIMDQFPTFCNYRCVCVCSHLFLMPISLVWFSFFCIITSALYQWFKLSYQQLT